MNDSAKPVYRITDLATEERPRERLVQLGPQALAPSELLAILLRVGVPGENAVQVGQRLLKDFGGHKEAAGFEIAFHNATFHTSTREETLRGLQRFYDYFVSGHKVIAGQILG